MAWSTGEKAAVAVGGLAGAGILAFGIFEWLKPKVDANGWTPVSQSAVPQPAIDGITTQINSAGAAWQPGAYSNGPQLPPVASPNAIGPEDATGPGPGTAGTPPFYALDNVSGQWYSHP